MNVQRCWEGCSPQPSADSTLYLQDTLQIASEPWACLCGLHRLVVSPRKGSREPLITAGEVAASDVWGQPCGTEPLVCGVCTDAGELVSKSNCGTPSWCRRIRELVGVETATFAVGQAETL